MNNEDQRRAIRQIAATPSDHQLELLGEVLRSPITLATAFMELNQMKTPEASGILRDFLREQSLTEDTIERLITKYHKGFFPRYVPKVMERYDEMPFSMLAIYCDCVNETILADFEAWRARQSKPIMTIAHIDDLDMTRFFYRLIINTQGDMISLGVAEETKTGGPMVKRLQPDLVILDHMLPGLNGIEALDYIRGLVPKSQIIFHSYRAGDKALEAEALAHGAQYIMPYTIIHIQEIPNTFRRVMGQSEL